MDERLESGGQARSTLKQASGHALTIARGQNAAQLSSASIACPGEGAFGRERRLFTTGQAGEIDIQDLVLLPVVMSIPLAVTSVDLVHGLLHLPDGVGSASRKRLLDDRLFSTAVPPKGQLQRPITAQAGIHLHDACGSRKDTDKRIGYFLKRGILDRFLRNLH